MGFYVIQFYAKPMLNHAGFLGNKRLYKAQIEKNNALSDNSKLKEKKLPDDPDLKDAFGHPRLNDKVKYFFGKTENYRSVKVFSSWIDDVIMLYVWSILFSQLVASILVGIVLQLLWEDRPITEPL